VVVLLKPWNSLTCSSFALVDAVSRFLSLSLFHYVRRVRALFTLIIRLSWEGRAKRERENDDDEDDNSTQEKTQWFAAWNRDIILWKDIDTFISLNKILFFFINCSKEQNLSYKTYHMSSIPCWIMTLKKWNEWTVARQVLFPIHTNQYIYRVNQQYKNRKRQHTYTHRLQHYFLFFPFSAIANVCV